MNFQRSASLFASLLLLALPLGSLHAEPAKAPLIFLMDASGSMLEIFQGVPRIVAARVMLEENLSRLPPGIATGLVAYGNGIPGCDSARLYVPVALGNRYKIATAVNKMSPGGNTPLARTLQLIRESLLPKHPGAKIIVISDGAESCGGDPVGQALALKAQGGAVQLNIIGLGVKQEEADELKKVAEAGNGTYYSVEKHDDFEKAFKQSINPDSSSLSSNPPAVVPPEKEQIKLSNARRIVEENGRQYFVFDYEIDSNQTDHFLRFTFSRSDGTPEQVKGAAIAVTGQPVYKFAAKAGSVRLEIPSGIKATQPIYVMGEMWDISSVPELRSYSKALPVQ